LTSIGDLPEFEFAEADGSAIYQEELEPEDLSERGGGFQEDTVYTVGRRLNAVSEREESAAGDVEDMGDTPIDNESGLTASTSLMGPSQASRRVVPSITVTEANKNAIDRRSQQESILSQVNRTLRGVRRLWTIHSRGIRGGDARRESDAIEEFQETWKGICEELDRFSDDLRGESHTFAVSQLSPFVLFSPLRLHRSLLISLSLLQHSFATLE
jgi:hypothetical protein